MEAFEMQLSQYDFIVDTNARSAREQCPVAARYTARILSESWDEPFEVRDSDSGYWVVPLSWRRKRAHVVGFGWLPMLTVMAFGALVELSKLL